MRLQQRDNDKWTLLTTHLSKNIKSWHQAGGAHLMPSQVGPTEVVGPIWNGLARDPFARCRAPPKTDRQLGRDEGVPFCSWRWCSDASPRMAHPKGLKNVIDVPFHIHVCPVDDLTSVDLWHYQLTYVYTNLIIVVDRWNSSPTVFTDPPDSRYPIKIKLCSFNQFCLAYVERVGDGSGRGTGTGTPFQDKPPPPPRLSRKGVLRAGSSINAPFETTGVLISKGCGWVVFCISRFRKFYVFIICFSCHLVLHFLSRLRSQCETIGVTIYGDGGDGGGVNISG